MKPTKEEERKLDHQLRRIFTQDKSKNRAMLEVFTEYYRDCIKDGTPELVCEDPVFLDIVSKVKTKEEKKEARENSKRLVWVTVNPRPEVTLREFRIKIDKCVSKKWIKEYYYAIEQRAETVDEMGKGIHVHILIDKGTKKPCQVREEIENTFKDLVKTYNHINIQIVGLDQKEKLLGYLQGDKEESKLKKVEIDDIWRVSEGLLPMYTSFDVQSVESSPSESED